MTIIYNYNKNNKHRPMIFYSGKNRLTPKKRKLRYMINEAGEYLGHIKLIVFLLVPFLMIGIFWLMLFGKNISLDYKIYNLKHEINRIEEENNLLTEKSANIISFKKIEDWAQANNFIEVKNISYLDLTNDNLAQR